MINRRNFLKTSAAGSMAMVSNSLFANGPMTPKAPHHIPKAKRVIFMFMHGGPSQVDTFDYKPLLQKNHGEEYPLTGPRIVSAKTGKLMASPFEFKQYGQSGIHVSELYKETAKHIDDICVINSMNGTNSRHGSALLELHCGSDTFVRPSMGSWITYGLGSENQSLPGYITICPGLGHGGVNAWSSSFLPAHYQGTPIGYSSVKAKNAKIGFIKNHASLPMNLQRQELDLIRRMNLEHLDITGPDTNLESRIESFELAYKMQDVAPKVQNLEEEPEHIKDMYGLNSRSTENFGRQCLMARRFAEEGVRFIQVSHGYWDQHSKLEGKHRQLAAETDRPIAGLLQDLKMRGMLEDTLVVWGGEFGRTPTTQGTNGRDHNNVGYTMWMAGGGIKGGQRYGATDDYGWFATENKVHVHDLHATMLWLLGMDHLKLTHKVGGRDFRLTDVYGHVVNDIIA